MKILIVEDDQDVRGELRLLLESAAYEVCAAEDFGGVAAQTARERPDLVLLDVKLPGRDGREICREIRQSANIPVIFLTGGGGVSDQIAGMLAGGDDYIAKPYHPALLLARIAAVLRRTQKKPDSYTFTHNGVTLDVRGYKISHAGRQAEVSKNECRLLHCLFLHPGEVVPRLELMDYLWDNEVFIDDNALSVTVTRIRARLEEIGVTGFIHTKRGAGYSI